MTQVCCYVTYVSVFGPHAAAAALTFVTPERLSVMNLLDCSRQENHGQQVLCAPPPQAFTEMLCDVKGSDNWTF